ncbi:hypothetical protein GWI33_005698 [Rhynchophorus ferrugineus]|uniref:Uncharacterized protein n=1 Tax=Rhynchophorus ferrugineus TaxID=354439 RepID=A0A834IMI1_RHYFE|nr:hypothetical protein GWI33_005698 [Rhynchophorus ferrugineus]
MRNGTEKRNFRRWKRDARDKDAHMAAIMHQTEIERQICSKLKREIVYSQSDAVFEASTRLVPPLTPSHPLLPPLKPIFSCFQRQLPGRVVAGGEDATRVWR